MERLIVNCETGESHTEAYTAEEIAYEQQMALDSAWNALRLIRDSKLQSSDWTVLGDSPTPTAAWKVYRQALRDLPANTTDPFNPVWPTPPS